MNSTSAVFVEERNRRNLSRGVQILAIISAGECGARDRSGVETGNVQ
jgi:hypothetical protein